jgi:high affinity Mn2+ porin
MKHVESLALAMLAVVTADAARAEDRPLAPAVLGAIAQDQPPASAGTARAAPAAERKPAEEVAPEDWSLHFQTTIVGQGYPGFPSTVQGPNSLPAHGQVRETISATAFLGRRLPWEGGELYIDPEFNQGFGLARTFGVAGFPNGEAQKAGFDTPKPNVARLFLRQTFGLGGEKETQEPDLNQLGRTVDVSRLTVTVGKFAVTDLFDDNQYAHDPRTTFLNWSVWESGAWDYPADQKGYTDGLVVELNQKRWALRGSWMLEPKFANQRNLDPRFWKSYGAAVELETRHEIFGAPGALRTLVFANRAPMGNLQQAADIAVATQTPADIAAVRHDRWKPGFALNLEQTVSDDFGFFTRFSWNDGRTEAWAFTDIDTSVATGVSLKGRSWSRERDTVGVAGVVNMLSKAHRNFFAAGGTGILIGDGRLDYAPEGIVEAYYNAGIVDPLSLTLDYQFIGNPAYNRDRGPVHVFALRLHFQY